MDGYTLATTILGAIMTVAMPFIAIYWSRFKTIVACLSEIIQDDKITADELRNFVAACLGK